MIFQTFIRVECSIQKNEKKKKNREEEIENIILFWNKN